MARHGELDELISALKADGFTLELLSADENGVLLVVADEASGNQITVLMREADAPAVDTTRPFVRPMGAMAH